MVDTRSNRQKGKTGVTFWTFGVEHYELEENTVQYEKIEKSQILQSTRLAIWDISCGT
jgi:hypothetical protein